MTSPSLPERVLVTGARGMLGQALGHSRPDGVVLLPTDVDELDITDETSVGRALAELRPDAVINAAAYTAVDRAEEDEAVALAVNGTAVGILGRACAAVGVPMVHVSTDYVFDGTLAEGASYREDDPTAPLSAYGRTKLAGEQALAASGARAWTVRTQWLYGLGGPNFVETMLKLAVDRDVLTVVDDQVGSPTSTHSLAPLLWSLLQVQPPTGLYHGVNRGACSWFDFARAIFEGAGVDVRVDPVPTSAFPRPARRPARSVLATDKLRDALGVDIPTWRSALDDYLARRTSLDPAT